MIAQGTQDMSRLGFHYYPDTLHYSQRDLQTWLPVLQRLNASWLVLLAPMDRAIPEAFLRALIAAQIQPILHFHLPLEKSVDLAGLQLLFRSYASWGAKYVILFDRPNSRPSWSAQSWVQAELAECFLDLFLPAAEMALQAGLIPVLPPLEPGGDYWDTAFLAAILRGIQRRGPRELLKTLALSAYAYVEDKPLDWGAGGPERWPSSRPYFLPAGQQDQRGFYIFNWYLDLAQAILGEAPPIFLLGAGSRLCSQAAVPPQADPWLEHAEKNLALAKLICASTQEALAEPVLEPVSPRVLVCNFWLLTAAADSPHRAEAWFEPDGSLAPVTVSFLEWLSPGSQSDPQAPPAVSPQQPQPPAQPDQRSFEHYLLLPLFDWGVSEWYLDAIRPYVLKHRPTVGFSPREAACARRVTVIGGEQLFTEDVLNELRNAGCRVDRIAGDGTEIASALATL